MTIKIHSRDNRQCIRAGVCGERTGSRSWHSQRHRVGDDVSGGQGRWEGRMRTRTRTAFEQFLMDHHACDTGMRHVRRYRGDFERSLRALLPFEPGSDAADNVIWLLDALGWYADDDLATEAPWRSVHTDGYDAGRFLRHEATKRGWMR